MSDSDSYSHSSVESANSDYDEYGQRQGEKFYDECNEIVTSKIKAAGEKIKVEILKSIFEENTIDHWRFYTSYDKYFKEEFGNILQTHSSSEIFMCFSRNLIFFCEYIGLEDHERLEEEVPKFLQRQLDDMYTWNQLTDHYYRYLVDYNGKIPDDLDEKIGKVKGRSFSEESNKENEKGGFRFSD